MHKYIPYTLKDYKANHPIPKRYPTLGGIGAAKGEEWMIKKKLSYLRKKYSKNVSLNNAEKLSRSEKSPLSQLKNEKPSSQFGRTKAI